MRKHVVIAPQATTPQRKFIENLAEKGLPLNADIIYEARNKVARVKIDGENWIVKEFQVPNIVNRYVYTRLRPSKARRSYEYALRLLGLGFLTPEPLAYIETWQGLSLGHTYYISREADAATLRNLTEKDHPLIEAFAAEIGRLHAAGIWHKDFTPGNILCRQEPAQSSASPLTYKFYYIDLNRMQFGIHDRRVLTNFGSIADTPLTEAIARAYAPYSPFALTPEQAATAARAARRHFLSRHPAARTPRDPRR